MAWGKSKAPLQSRRNFTFFPKDWVRYFKLSISSNKPIGFGILTCENKTQALQRADANSGNKGREAAKACLDLLKLNYGQ